MDKWVQWLSLGVALASFLWGVHQHYSYLGIRQVLQSSVNTLWSAHIDGKALEESITDPEAKLKIQVLRTYIVALHNSLTAFLKMTKKDTHPGDVAFYIRVFDAPIVVGNGGSDQPGEQQ